MILGSCTGWPSFSARFRDSGGKQAQILDEQSRACSSKFCSSSGSSRCGQYPTRSVRGGLEFSGGRLKKELRFHSSGRQSFLLKWRGNRRLVFCWGQQPSSENVGVGDLKFDASAVNSEDSASSLGFNGNGHAKVVPSNSNVDEMAMEGSDVPDRTFLSIRGLPKRWTIVLLCFFSFLLCNMDRVLILSSQLQLKLFEWRLLILFLEGWVRVVQYSNLDSLLILDFSLEREFCSYLSRRKCLHCWQMAITR